MTSIINDYISLTIKYKEKFCWSDEFTPKTLERIVNALAESKKITELLLNQCLISDEQIVKLARALKKNKTLQTLRVYNTTIGDAGGVALADFIATSDTLECIDFDFNTYTSIGLIAIGEAMGKSKTLSDLFIRNALNEEKFINVMAKTIEESQSIRMAVVFFPTREEPRKITDAKLASDAYFLLCMQRDDRVSLRSLRWLFEDYTEMLEEMRFLACDFLRADYDGA